MKDNEILLAAINKAKENGFELVSHKHFCETKEDALGRIIGISAYESIIFDRHFAKAFWPGLLGTVDGQLWVECKIGNTIEAAMEPATKAGFKSITPAFLYHLSQMAISENRLQYLAKFL